MDERRKALLDAAVATFVRYGFRKTSMEEVARTAHVSRQGLYLHFPTKEDLFRAAVQHALENGLEAASLRLRDEAASLEDRLVGAFDETIGRFIGMSDVSDLESASKELVGPILAESHERLLDRVAKVVRGTSPAGLSARQLADTLAAMAKGLKHSCATRAEFVERFRVAVRAMCLRGK